MNPLTIVFETVHRPEYTGENRCVPCTVINLAIAIVFAAVATSVWPPAGAIIFSTSLLVIYLQGYLVPGTPTLTKRYVPEWLLARFDKAPDSEPENVPQSNNPKVIEDFLVSAGVLEECIEDADLCLTPGFRRTWRDRIETHRNGAGTAFQEALDVSDLLDVDPARLDVDRFDPAMVASVDDMRIARWESEAAYVADLAAAAELDARCDAWGALGFESRTQILGALRLWLDRCPDCDGLITFGQETLETCCRSRDVLAATCQECDAPISYLNTAGESRPSRE